LLPEEQDIALNKVVQPTVVEHKVTGMILSLSEGGSAILPYEEISFDPDFDPRDHEAIRAQFPKDSSVQVFLYRMAATGTYLLASIRLIEQDPWKEEVSSWKEHEQICVMTVREVSNTQFMGGIQPARVTLMPCSRHSPL